MDIKNVVVRLSSLELNNIKNVKNGKIIMPSTFKKNYNSSNAEILGIYGQNGSGKTAVINTLYFLQKIMKGEAIEEEFKHYIESSSNYAKIVAEFHIYKGDTFYEVGYQLEFKRDKDKIYIEKELLNRAKTVNGERIRKKMFMEYSMNEQTEIFKPYTSLEELISKSKDYKLDLMVSKKLAVSNNTSFIFSKPHLEILTSYSDGDFKEYIDLIQALNRFVVRDLFVIKSSQSASISANDILPMTFRIDRQTSGIKGDFKIPLMNPLNFDKTSKKLLEEIIEQINIVLCTIIPGLTITIRDHGLCTLDDGSEGWRLELMSSRNGGNEIPIRMESEGIIKIISILNALIKAFANPSICIAIDELDAGIYEYMLGELLDIFNKSAKGQLIFTSHNLRALEMLDKDSIVFSTTNPENRYIRLKNTRESNNLRKLYIRSITLGGYDEEIYEETDSLKIARSFRKAARGIHNE